MDLYFTLFGLSRPSCLPLPELGLVLNLKEKKAVLNPTIIPESVANNQEPVNNPNNHGQLIGFQSTVSTDHLHIPLPPCFEYSTGSQLYSVMNSNFLSELSRLKSLTFLFCYSHHFQYSTNLNTLSLFLSSTFSFLCAFSLMCGMIFQFVC